MNWIVVKYLPLEQDLTPLARFLSARGFIYRVSEEDGQQVLSVQDPQLVEPLTQLVEQFMRGEIDLPASAGGGSPREQGLSPFVTPVTLSLIMLSVIGALLIMTDYGQQFALLFTFQGVVDDQFISLRDSLAAGEYWRLLTPAFLHFSFFHVLFNCLWMWELGRRVELGLGKFAYLAFFIVTAVAANLAQYFWGGGGVFGGMSGVVYALVGFIWLRRQLTPNPLYALPLSIIGFMLVWLVLCMSGIVDKFIGGSIANAAHVGGLFAGMLLGAISGFYVRASGKNE